MKTRNGFVSNSSSSSFIIWSQDFKKDRSIEKIKALNISDRILTLEFGETQYGWQVERYDDFRDKVNIAYLLASGPDQLEMLNKVLKEEFDVEGIIFCADLTEGYIDHQSREDDHEVFKDEDNLKNFLFNSNTFWQNDNDNY